MFKPPSHQILMNRPCANEAEVRTQYVIPYFERLGYEKDYLSEETHPGSDNRMRIDIAGFVGDRSSKSMSPKKIPFFLAEIKKVDSKISENAYSEAYDQLYKYYKEERNSDHQPLECYLMFDLTGDECKLVIYVFDEEFRYKENTRPMTFYDAMDRIPTDNFDPERKIEIYTHRIERLRRELRNIEIVEDSKDISKSINDLSEARHKEFMKVKESGIENYTEAVKDTYGIEGNQNNWYRIVGMGKYSYVIVAKHPEYKTIAIKIIKKEVKKEEPLSIGRLRRSYKNLVRLKKTNAGNILLKNIIDPMPGDINSTYVDSYMMAYIEHGSSLKYAVKELSLMQKINIMLILSKVVQFCFENDVIHGDLHPGNVLLRQDDSSGIVEPVLIDFD